MSTQLRLTEANLVGYLRDVGFIPRSASARVEPLGDGNINWVRRVRSGADTWVVKQARPALERFPEYRVSTQRIVFEARYYETVRGIDRAGVCLEVLHCDVEQKVLVLEDLGEAERLDAALARGADVAEAAAALASFLGAVHAGSQDGDLAARFRNDEMQRLHGEHVFRLPYRPNDFPLSGPVAEAARAIQADAELLESIDAAYQRYLEPRGALVHGDVQATNVLLSQRGPRLIDAEIAHVGDPAFDLGQLVGHLLLPAAARRQPAAAGPAVGACWSAYRRARGSEAAVALDDVARYAGIELLRRTIGAARVPAVSEDAASLAVLELGLRLVREGASGLP